MFREQRRQSCVSSGSLRTPVYRFRSLSRARSPYRDSGAECVVLVRFAIGILIVMSVTVLPVSASPPNYWALLIGVSEYPALGPERQLRGPRNDVSEMRATLRQLRGDWRRITTLADGVRDADGLPTHD